MPTALRIPDALPLSAWGVVLDPAEVATSRTPLDINSDTITIDQTGIDFGDAAIQEFLADMAVGSTPVDYRLPNRTVTITLSVGRYDADETAFLAAKAALQQKVALIQREGGWLKRDTGVPLFADVVGATLTFPDHWGPTGFIENDVKLVLECLPDFYGAEVTLDAIGGTGYVASVLQRSGAQAVVAGDHPGRVRIVVTDTSGNNQDGLFWAFRSRHYDATTTAAVTYVATAMTPLDAAAVAFGTIQHPSLPGGSWCPVMLTDLVSGGALTHTGTYRVIVRAQSGNGIPQLRLAWGQGGVAAPVLNDAVTLPVSNQFCLLDLGVIRVDQPPVGAHAWQGIVQANAPTTGTVLQIHRVWLVPLDESAGQANAEQSPSPFGISQNGFPTVAANDAATGTVDWTNLPGAFSGLSTNPATAVLSASTSHYLKATGCGFAIPTGSTISGVTVTVVKRGSGFSALTDAAVRLVRAGTVEATDRADTVTPWHFSDAFAAYGGQSDLWGAAWTPANINAAGFGVAIAATGVGTAKVWEIAVTVSFTTAGGFATSVNAVVFASQPAEVRTDGVFRLLPGGAYGPIVSEGDLPRIPPSGQEGRPVELLVKPSRGDLETIPDSAVDGLTAQVLYRPSYLFPT